VDPGHRGLLSIELGYAKETVSLLLSKLANPEDHPEIFRLWAWQTQGLPPGSSGQRLVTVFNRV